MHNPESRTAVSGLIDRPEEGEGPLFGAVNTDYDAAGITSCHRHRRKLSFSAGSSRAVKAEVLRSSSGPPLGLVILALLEPRNEQGQSGS